MAAYTDDELIAELAVARGDDRTCVVTGLAHSVGDRGADVARHLATRSSGESGHVRSAAIRALASRVGADATDVYAEALSDRSVEVQLAASASLAEVGDGRGADAMLAWLRRKLRRPTRASNWDSCELRDPLLFATRHPEVAPRLARLIATDARHLQPEERDWLDAVWRSWRGDGPITAPDASLAGLPMLEEHRSSGDREEPWAAWEQETLAPILRRLAPKLLQ